jgi:hypothetical protein
MHCPAVWCVGQNVLTNDVCRYLKYHRKLPTHASLEIVSLHVRPHSKLDSKSTLNQPYLNKCGLQFWLHLLRYCAQIVECALCPLYIAHCLCIVATQKKRQKVLTPFSLAQSWLLRRFI